MDRYARSPERASGIRKRSRSPSHHSYDHPRRDRRRSPIVQPFPFGASTLHKRDFVDYKPMFALYLDVQKRIELEELSENEVKGRWKSFVGKW